MQYIAAIALASAFCLGGIFVFLSYIIIVLAKESRDFFDIFGFRLYSEFIYLKKRTRAHIVMRIGAVVFFVSFLALLFLGAADL
ncbi:hypothetical protein [Brevundimonas diminuta]|uniref:hypothetical protein n=1 Tax=Brevundimonas diminuta TaxID=293 RepID=UPI0032085E8A